jgi:hypothetical protein
LISSAKRHKLPFSRNELFNEIIADEIKKERDRYRNLQMILEDDPEDLIVKEDTATKRTGATTDRSNTLLNDSFASFKKQDIVVPID